MITNIKNFIESLSSHLVCGTIYRYSVHHKKAWDKTINLHDEFLCSAMIRMLTLRNYRKLNIKRLDIINSETQEDDFIDCLVNVNIDLKYSFILFNGQKVRCGNVWLSKDEILTMNNDNEIRDTCKFQPKVIKYFANAQGALQNYIAMIDYCTSLANNSSYLSEQAESTKNTLISNLPLEARVYIAELIKRDCCFITKNTIQKSLSTKKILFVNNEEIGYN